MIPQKKNKTNGTKGILGSISHVIILTAFSLQGLSYTIPPPKEEGISINFFGNTEDGSRNTA